MDNISFQKSLRNVNQTEREGRGIAMNGLIQISKYAGMRNDLAQAGGGNTSVKIDDQIMLVKSSGCQLADMSKDNGYMKVNYRLIAEYLEQNTAAGELTEEEGKRLLVQAQMEDGHASIETFLHAVTDKYTLHSHPTLVNILTSRKGGRKELQELFPEAVFVPYKKPGAALAEACYRACREQASGNHSQEVIFLENHGLVVSADTSEHVIEKTEVILRKIADHLHISNRIYSSATRIWDMFLRIPQLQEMIVYPAQNQYLSWDYIGDGLVGPGLWNHAFCPDCVVYGSRKMLCLSDDFSRKDIVDFMDAYGAPVLICYRKHIYIVAESVKKAQEIENVMSFGAQVQMANLGQEMNYLSESEQDELLNWDCEKYRRMMK